jgi:rhodanese-related sulfurtransferase
MQQTLKEANIQSVEVTQVVKLQQSGYTLVDVRPGEDFEESHIKGSVSVPLFGPIQISSPAKLLKSLMYAANGMKGTDENPRFVDEVRGRAGSNRLAHIWELRTRVALGVQPRAPTSIMTTRSVSKRESLTLRVLAQVFAAVPQKSKVLVICDSGGTYKPISGGVVPEVR